MNRYQLEVAELDRRHRLKMRAVSFVGAAMVMIVALWSAGVPPTSWLNAIRSWTDSSSSKPQPETQSSPLPDVTEPSSNTTAPAESLAGTDTSTSKVPLPLLLVATSPGRSIFEGTAKMGTDLNNPQTYMAGALLMNGARLAEIHKDHVILQRGAKRARLSLVGPEGAPSGEVDELLTEGGARPSIKLPLPSHEIVTDYIRPSPVFDGDQLRGYEVYAGQNTAVFAQLGLQAGDVIIALNDMPLNEPSLAMDLFRQFSSGTAMTATIERKGKRERIGLDGAIVTADQARRGQAQALSQSELVLPHS